MVTSNRFYRPGAPHPGLRLLLRTLLIVGVALGGVTCSEDDVNDLLGENILCDDDADCDPGDRCVDSVCVLEECQDDTDCPGGETCNAGFCEP